LNRGNAKLERIGMAV